jgi:hypothetical protein
MLGSVPHAQLDRSDGTEIAEAAASHSVSASCNEGASKSEPPNYAWNINFPAEAFFQAG